MTADAPDTPPTAPELTVVVPVHNEAGNIGPLLDEIVSALADEAFEVVVVDDASVDASGEEVAAAMAARGEIRLVRHRARAGKSRALVTGVGAARGGWVGTLDGDGQNDPRDLARIWRRAKTERPNALFAGVRRRRNDGAVKRMTSRIANAVRKRLLRDDCRDAACGLKLMPTAFARRLPYFDNMHRFYPALARRDGLDVIEETIDDRPRRHGASKYGFFDRAAVALLDVMGVYWLTRRYSDPGAAEETSPPTRSNS